MRKQRSPAILYSYVVMSSGIYAFFWAVALLQDLNELSGSPKFDVATLRRTVVVSLLAYALAVLYLMATVGSIHRPSSFRWFVLALVFGLYALLIWLVLR